MLDGNSLPHVEPSHRFEKPSSSRQLKADVTTAESSPISNGVRVGIPVPERDQAENRFSFFGFSFHPRNLCPFFEALEEATAPKVSNSFLTKVSTTISREFSSRLFFTMTELHVHFLVARLPA